MSITKLEAEIDEVEELMMKGSDKLLYYRWLSLIGLLPRVYEMGV